MTDDETFTSADEAIAAAWSTIEPALVKGFEDVARKLGTDEMTIVRARACFAQLLRESWENQRETAKQMLEHRCSAVH